VGVRDLATDISTVCSQAITADTMGEAGKNAIRAYAKEPHLPVRILSWLPKEAYAGIGEGAVAVIGQQFIACPNCLRQSGHRVLGCSANLTKLSRQPNQPRSWLLRTASSGILSCVTTTSVALPRDSKHTVTRSGGPFWDSNFQV